MTTNLLNLESRYLSATVNPGRGGSLNNFRFQHKPDKWIDIFQNTQMAGANTWGYFIMAPLTGRTYEGKFVWRGEIFELSPVLNSRHAIHGPARQHPWVVKRNSATRVSLSLSSTDWPDTMRYTSDYRMTLDYELDDDTLHVLYSITNTGKNDLPSGGGSHPFVNKLLEGCTNPAIWQFDAECRFVPRADTPDEAMPTGNTESMSGELSFSNGRVADEGWDHCLQGWGKTATATWMDIGVKLTFGDHHPNSAGFAHFWYPKGRNVCAFEAENAIGNAPNLEGLGVRTGLRLLKPGEKAWFHHTFRVSNIDT